MESLNKNGVSITQTPEEEKYMECCIGAFRGQIYIQYDYRHTNGKLFSPQWQKRLKYVAKSGTSG